MWVRASAASLLLNRRSCFSLKRHATPLASGSVGIREEPHIRLRQSPGVLRGNSARSCVRTQRSCMRTQKVLPASSEVIHANSPSHASELSKVMHANSEVILANSQVIHANSEGHASELFKSCQRAQRSCAQAEARVQAPRDTEGVQTSDSGAGRSGGGPELPADSNDVDRAAGAAGPACALIGGWSDDFTWIHGDLRL